MKGIRGVRGGDEGEIEDSKRRREVRRGRGGCERGVVRGRMKEYRKERGGEGKKGRGGKDKN
jgi:hypothetical protein